MTIAADPQTRQSVISRVREAEISLCYDYFAMAIEIRLNGETRSLPDSINIVQLLDHFSLPKDRVAVERNRSIVSKSDWERVVLTPGDNLEVVTFVGGGEALNDD